MSRLQRKLVSNAAFQFTMNFLSFLASNKQNRMCTFEKQTMSIIDCRITVFNCALMSTCDWVADNSINPLTYVVKYFTIAGAFRYRSNLRKFHIYAVVSLICLLKNV